MRCRVRERVRREGNGFVRVLAQGFSPSFPLFRSSFLCFASLAWSVPRGTIGSVQVYTLQRVRRIGSKDTFNENVPQLVAIW